MPLFNMAKKDAKKDAKAAAAPADGSPRASAEPQRPGTSGTEMFLTDNRRTASANYQAAQRAENAYKAKKRSSGARQHRHEATSHFKQSARHLKEGIKSTFRFFAAAPWVLRGWKENRQSKKEKKARERDLEKKKKLEERIAKQAQMEKEAGKDGASDAA